MFPSVYFTDNYFAGVYYVGADGGENDPPIPPLDPSSGAIGNKGIRNKIGSGIPKVGASRL